jgi:hypothetical protein
MTPRLTIARTIGTQKPDQNLSAATSPLLGDESGPSPSRNSHVQNAPTESESSTHRAAAALEIFAMRRVDANHVRAIRSVVTPIRIQEPMMDTVNSMG